MAKSKLQTLPISELSVDTVFRFVNGRKGYVFMGLRFAYGANGYGYYARFYDTNRMYYCDPNRRVLPIF